MIIKGYRGREGDLIQILFANINKDFIGPVFVSKLAWYSAPILLILALLTKNQKIIVALLFFGLNLAILLVFNSFFFQHGGIAMLAQYIFLIILIIALSIGAIYEFQIKKFNRNL